MYTQYNEFQKGMWILALYPGARRHNAPELYKQIPRYLSEQPIAWEICCPIPLHTRSFPTDTTCFYKALVHTPPSEMDEPPRDYLVEFEDESEASGKSEPMRVPQKYVMRMADGR